ncbi:MGC69309 protein precursor [Xenopus tropicalis]|eukprot:NP_001004837.1 MGC69309 protein precursor [Xenopus tropicalis]
MSLGFLVLWVVMDTLNVAGTFLADQLPLQKYFSINCILCDSLLLGIYCYFRLRKWRPRSHTPLHTVCGFALLGSVATFSLLQESEPAVQNLREMIPSRRLLSADGEEDGSIRMKMGYTLGIIVSGMWIVFRIPQIVTNFRRKSVEGLALGMFLLMMVENLCFGLSIVLKSPRQSQTEASKALHHLPWLIACVGSVGSDWVLMYQFIRYRPRAQCDEEEPLLLSSVSLYG